MKKLKYPIHFEVEVNGVPLFSNFSKQAITYSERCKASSTKSFKNAIKNAKKHKGANVIAYWLEDKPCVSNLLTGRQTTYGQRCVYGNQKGSGFDNGNSPLESFINL